MFARKTWIVVGVGILLLLVLAGCTVEEPVLPEREIVVSLETALAAQESAMGQALASGEITLTEEEVSSILTYLAQQSSGEYNVVDEIKVWFEENGDVTSQISLLEGTLPEAFGSDDVVIKGNIQATEEEEESAHFSSPKHYRFGLAAMVAQDDDAADAVEEAADEAEEALEGQADEMEQAAREQGGELRASVSEFQVGQVQAAQEVMPAVEDLLNSVFSWLDGLFEDVSFGEGEININI